MEHEKPFDLTVPPDPGGLIFLLPVIIGFRDPVRSRGNASRDDQGGFGLYPKQWFAWPDRVSWLAPDRMSGIFECRSGDIRGCIAGQPDALPDVGGVRGNTPPG